MKKSRVQQEVENYIIGLKGRDRELIKNELFWYGSGRTAGVAFKPIYLGFNYLNGLKVNKKYNINEESIQEFVESLYEDGRTPSDRFGISHEELGKLEQELFDRADVIDLVDCGFVQGMSEEEIMQHFLESQELVKKVKQFKKLQDNMNTAIDKIESMSQDAFYNACVKAGYTPIKKGNENA